MSDPIQNLIVLIHTNIDYDDVSYQQKGAQLLKDIMSDATLCKRAIKEIQGFSKFYCNDDKFLLYSLNRLVHG